MKPVKMSCGGSGENGNFTPGGHSAILDSQGRLWAWGDNSYGQCIDGTRTNISTPTLVSTSAFSEVICGTLNIFVIDTSGSVYGSGYNYYGNIGCSAANTTIATSLVKIARPGSYSKAALASRSSFVIDGSNGMIYASGENVNGVLGYNADVTIRSSHVAIARVGSYSHIATKTFSVAAIDASNGMIYTWGRGSGGQLGDGTITSKSSPVAIARAGSYSTVRGGGDPEVAGDSFYAAIESSTGMIYTWGYNGNGELGDGTRVNKSSPVAIARVSSYSKVDCGINSMVAIDGSDGSIWVWGSNRKNQLGIGEATIPEQFQSSPIRLSKTGSFVDVFCNGLTSHTIDHRGVLWSWGENSTCQMGKGVENRKYVPTKIMSNVKTAKVGGNYTSDFNYNTALVVIDNNGDLFMKGYTGFGVTALSAGWFEEPRCYVPLTQINLSGMSAVNVSVTNLNIGVLLSDGTIHIAGYSTSSTQGAGDGVSATHTNYYLTPISATNTFSQFNFNGNHSLAIDASNGQIWSWGRGGDGQIGQSISASNSIPAPISRAGSYSKISTSFWSSMAIDAATGMVYTWGANPFGQLGDNSRTTRFSPVPISRAGSYKEIVMGYNNSFVIDGSTGMLYGCGRGGGIGDNTTTSRSVMTAIARTGSYTKIAAGVGHFLAIDGSDGSIWSWGGDHKGQMGIDQRDHLGATNSNHYSPMKVVSNKSFRDVWASNQMSLAIDSDDDLYVWGAVGECNLIAKTYLSTPVYGGTDEILRNNSIQSNSQKLGVNVIFDNNIIKGVK